jgi:hypothetical protein
MDVSQEFFRWAHARGVVSSGIVPQQIPDQGIGIVATRTLKVEAPNPY